MSFFITMAELPKSEQTQDERNDKETPPIPEFVVANVLVDEEFSLISQKMLGQQTIEYIELNNSSGRKSIDCVGQIPLPTAPVEPELSEMLPPASTGKLSENVLDEKAEERMKDSCKTEQEGELSKKGREIKNISAEVTKSHPKNEKNNQLTAEENGTEDAKNCLPSDHSVSLSATIQEIDEFADKENLIYNIKNEILPVSSTITNGMKKRKNTERQKNHTPRSLIVVTNKNEGSIERLRKSETIMSPEATEKTTAKLSDKSPRSNKPRSSPKAVATPKSNFATIAEAVEALKRKREEKKDRHKVAPSSIQFDGSAHLDLSAVKIGSVRGRRWYG